MSFTSPDFLFFFLIVFGVIFLAPQQLRSTFLTVFSILFCYFSQPDSIYYICTVGIVAYLGGLTIGFVRHKFLWLIVLLSLFVFAFFYFKFLDYLIHNFSSINTEQGGIDISKIFIPIGISFYFFQTIGYLIDVYNEQNAPEKNVTNIFFYLFYFPKLLSGPIEKYKNFTENTKVIKRLTYVNLVLALRLILWGYFKKIAIADYLNISVTNVFSHTQQFSGISFFIAAFFYAIIAYCDFSGYTDLARGYSRLLGIELSQNFNRPYLSKSVTEYWRKWHMSLIGWFNEYLYTPIVFTFRSIGLTSVIIGILVVFALSGLWHGFALTYLVWGLLQAFAIIYELKTRKFRDKYFTKSSYFRKFALGTIFTVLFAVFTDVFFRAESLSAALAIYQKMFSGMIVSIGEIISNKNLSRQHILYLGQDAFYFLSCCAFILLLFIIEYIQRNDAIEILPDRVSPITRWFFYYTILLVIAFYGNVGNGSFIYFGF